MRASMGWDGIDTLIARPQAQGTQDDVLNTMRGGDLMLSSQHPTPLSTAALSPDLPGPLAPGPALEWPSSPSLGSRA